MGLFVPQSYGERGYREGGPGHSMRDAGWRVAQKTSKLERYEVVWHSDESGTRYSRLVVQVGYLGLSR